MALAGPYYIMPGKKFPYQSGKAVLVTYQEFYDCCCAEPIPCDDCQGNEPLTITITTTGDCEYDEGCAGQCPNAVLSAPWTAGTPHAGCDGYWFDSCSDCDGPGTGSWFARVYCRYDVWYIQLVGGCYYAGSYCSWGGYPVGGFAFTPSGCVRDNGNGYPTHPGVNLGEPHLKRCWDGCIPTMALS